MGRAGYKTFSRFSKFASLFFGLFILFCPQLFALTPPKHISGNLETLQKMDEDFAQLFGTILVQGRDGRTKPMDTVAADMVRKVTGELSFKGLTYNQIAAGMILKPELWQTIPIVKVNDPGIKQIIGLDADEEYFAFEQILENGNYKLSDALERAQSKKKTQQSSFERELLQINEKLTLLYGVYIADAFKVFPQKGGVSHAWHNPSDMMRMASRDDRMAINRLQQSLFYGVENGLRKGEWSDALKAVEAIKTYQREHGAALIPADMKIEAEIFYNRMDLMTRLFPVYLIAGGMLLMLIFVQILKSGLNVRLLETAMVRVLAIGFVVHTAALVIRWYIAGHAPWSNTYETMLYIAWSVLLAGTAFARYSKVATASAGIFAGIVLFAASLDWLDPHIANLPPILKSYWFTIHVSVITASYGLLGLSAMLGALCLVLFVLLKRENEEGNRGRIIRHIKEMTQVNEMAMIVGLSLITAGNFLGAAWANVSWGRSWGWDSKETWTLVTILVYAAVLHMRYIPRLNTPYIFSLFSLVAYSSVLMTYFGVNYYLSGLHSYASGDAIPVPGWVYAAVFGVGALIVVSFHSRNTYRGKGMV